MQTDGRFPFYHLVPKDVPENAAYRLAILDRAKSDTEYRAACIEMCRRDPLFFLNSFCYLYEPRSASVLPFVTYPTQDELVEALTDVLGTKDLGVEKSRDQGASWTVLAYFLQRFRFHRLQSFILASRGEDQVDATDDPDALFWKFDFLWNNLPKWMQVPIQRTSMHCKNLDNGSVIDGVSSSGNMARGGRRLAMMMDEFAAFEFDKGYKALSSSQFATNTRVFVSTPQGDQGAFADMMIRTPIRKVSMRWQKHPLQRRGLYTSEAGELKVLDTSYEFPADYPYILDGKLRSPYYDEQCAKSPIPQLIAQELDISYVGSNFSFFDESMLAKIREQHCRQPMSEMVLRDLIDDELPADVWTRAGLVSLKLWTTFDAYGHPPRDRQYVVGADVSAGTGASNSTLSVFDCRTREKVAACASARMMAHEWAHAAIAVARLFKGSDVDAAKIVFEQNGPGRAFGGTLQNLGHTNFYFRRNEVALSHKTTDTPGWIPTRENKIALLESYREALHKGLYINRDAESIEECREYVHVIGGGVEHKSSSRKIDPSGAASNHGDRVIADALTWWVAKDQTSEKPKAPDVLPASCKLSRVRRARELATAGARPW